MHAGASAGTRLPTYYVPHGGGPWPFMEWPPVLKAGNDALEAFLRRVLADAGTRPKAMLVVSAHWEAPQPTVMENAEHTLLYDYTNFPAHTYALQYPAPGAPAVAARVRELLSAAGIAAAGESARGLDHGTFIPFMLIAPAADIPIVQLSLIEGYDPAAHLAVGRALAPLRDEGVLIVGSGMSYHNMDGFFKGRDPAGAAEFDAWLVDAVEAEPSTRNALLAHWERAPGARQAHPEEDHLIPLMVVAGAAPEGRGHTIFRDRVLGAPVSGFRFD
jgi:aromatic ring-opening dioxygenase catalytic subunit (LigB family)